MQVIHLTHNDLDGVACSVLAERQYVFPQTPHKYSVGVHDYTTIDQAINTALSNLDFKDVQALSDTLLLITDICPSRDTLEKMDEAHKVGLQVALYDHHKTRKFCSEYPWGHYEDGHCGTEMYFNQAATFDDRVRYKEFVYGVNAYDLWDLRSPYRTKGEQLNLLLRFLGTSRFLELFSLDPWLDTRSEFRRIIGILEDNKKEAVAKLISKQLASASRHVDALGRTYKVLVAGEHTPDIGHNALFDADNEDLKYVVVVNPMYGTASLYAREDETDVSDIAKRVGGGGHQAAAGFPFDSGKLIERGVSTILNKIDTD